MDNPVGTFDIYYQDLNLKHDKVKIASGSFMDTFYIADDLTSMYYVQDHNLFQVDNQGNKKNLDDHVDDILSIDFSTGSLYYTVKKDRILKAWDYVIDDKKAVDSQITEPNQNDYMIEKTYSSYLGTYKTLDREKYHTALETYWEKKNRDLLRKKLQNLNTTITDTQLYYYADGKSTLVTNQFYSDYPAKSIKNEPCWLLYSRGENAELKKDKMKLSTISSLAEVQSYLNEIENQDQVLCLNSQGIETELYINGEVPNYVIKDSDNNRICFVSKSKLYSISLKKNDNFGKLEVLDESVDRIELVNDGNIYYLKNVTNYYQVELYCNGKYITSNVNFNSCETVPNSKAILCMTDSRTLKLVKNNNIKEIGKNVFVYTAFEENSIAMITDYHSEEMKGNLIYYNGKKLADVDTDVRCFFGHSY